VLRLANRTDIALIVLAYFLSAALAAAYNLLLVIWGEYVDDYSNPPEYVRDAVKETSLVILYAMILSTCCHLFNATIWSLVARSIGISLRIKYFSGLMNRPLHWLAINKRRIKCTFERDCVSLEKIISTVIPNIIKHLTTSLGGFAIALDYNWELALVGIISTGILYLAVKVSQRIQQGGEFNSERSEREREAVSTETLGVAEDGYWAFSVPEQNKEMR
jgi:ABC-type multidrug transport system fused ATPase/permease subunit